MVGGLNRQGQAVHPSHCRHDKPLRLSEGIFSSEDFSLPSYPKIFATSIYSVAAPCKSLYKVRTLLTIELGVKGGFPRRCTVVMPVPRRRLVAHVADVKVGHGELLNESRQRRAKLPAKGWM